MLCVLRPRSFFLSPGGPKPSRALVLAGKSVFLPEIRAKSALHGSIREAPREWLVSTENRPLCFTCEGRSQQGQAPRVPNRFARPKDDQQATKAVRRLADRG